MSRRLVLGDAPEEGPRAVLAALVSSLADAAGEDWLGAFLGGAMAHGEGPAAPPDDAVPFELWAVVRSPPSRVPALQRRLSRALVPTARSRRAAARVHVLSAAELDALPPTRDLLEALAAAHVVSGPDDLLAGAKVAGEARPALLEALRLLVVRGASLLEAERGLSGNGSASAARRAASAVREVDVVLGEAALLSAGRWVAGEEARSAALRELASSDASPAGGFHVRMTWTRFKDLVERHRAALRDRASGPGELELPLARKEAARAADRFLEVLRLVEEERLGVELPDWTAHARALVARGGAPSLPLFGELLADDGPDGLPSPLSVRRLPTLWRLAAALGAQLDWDPSDLPVAHRLLGLPDSASRDRLAQRTAALASTL